MNVAATVVSALFVFAATNIDDILLLSLFFADRRVRPQAVVIGQFLGIAGLVLASVLSGWAAVAIPPGYLRYLGVLPLLLGLWELIKLVRRRGGDDDDDEHSALADARSGTASQVLGITGVMLANGGDNLSVYIPLFAAKPQAIVIYVVVFTLMTGVWCVLGFLLVQNRVLGDKLRRYGHVLLPAVLILLGLHILLS